MKQKMSTIDLTCANCKCIFSKTAAEYKRRLCKLPDSINFFCSRSCGATFNNSRRENNGAHLIQYRFEPGNVKGQLYDQQFTWYIHRLTSDHRRDLKYVGDRQELQEVLRIQWETQQHQCAFTNLPLSLKVGSLGKCSTTNPFYIASIDRINNRLPYQLGNIQWVSTAMNCARGNRDIETFKQDLGSFLLDVDR